MYEATSASKITSTGFLYENHIISSYMGSDKPFWKGEKMKRARGSPKTSRQRDKNKQATENLCKVPYKFADMAGDLENKGWSTDILTDQIERAFCNIGVSFLQLRPYFNLLIKATEIFGEANGLMSYSELDGLISVGLFARTAGCFLGAARLSFSGQQTESWALLRACIENSLYACYVFGNPELAQVWSDRHKSEKNKNKCKSEFTIKNVFTALEKRSKSIAKEAKQSYDMTIDFGAHPNERSLFPNLQEKQDGHGFNLNIFNNDPYIMRSTLVIIAMISSLVFKIFALIFPDVFKQPNLAIKIKNLDNEINLLLHVVKERLSPDVN